MIGTAFGYAFGFEKRFPYFLPPGNVFCDDKFMERANDYNATHQTPEDVEECPPDEGPPLP